jgi:DNA-binding Xre family transcriptional regulator
MLVATTKRNKIPEILDDLGWTIQDLSRKVVMTYHHVHKIVRAEQIPPGTTYETLTRISTALGVSIDDLEEVVEE